MLSPTRLSDSVWWLSHNLLISLLESGCNLYFLSADISCLFFLNTVMTFIPKLTNVLGSNGCCWYWSAALDIYNIAEVARLIDFWMSANLLSAHLWKGKILLLLAISSFSFDTFAKNRSCLAFSVCLQFAPPLGPYRVPLSIAFLPLQPTSRIWLVQRYLKSGFYCLFDLTSLTLQIFHLL